MNHFIHITKPGFVFLLLAASFIGCSSPQQNTNTVVQKPRKPPISLYVVDNIPLEVVFSDLDASMKKNSFEYMDIAILLTKLEASEGSLVLSSFYLIRSKDTATLNNYIRLLNVKEDKLISYGLPGHHHVPRKADYLPLYILKKDSSVHYKEMDIEEVRPSFDGMARPAISVVLNEKATPSFLQFTRMHSKSYIAFVIDSIVYSAPFLAEPLNSGRFDISGYLTRKEISEVLQVPFTITDKEGNPIQ